MEREVGGGIGMGNTCKSMADSFQYMTKPTTIKKKKKNLNIQNNENHGIWSHNFMADRRGKSGNSDKLYFFGLQNHCRW